MLSPPHSRSSEKSPAGVRTKGMQSLRAARTVGLDAKRLEKDMESPDVERVIRRNYALAEALKLTGTPSFLIGGTLLRGGRDLDTLLAIVKAEREKG